MYGKWLRQLLLRQDIDPNLQCFPTDVQSHKIQIRKVEVDFLTQTISVSPIQRQTPANSAPSSQRKSDTDIKKELAAAGLQNVGQLPPFVTYHGHDKRESCDYCYSSNNEECLKHPQGRACFKCFERGMLCTFTSSGLLSGVSAASKTRREVLIGLEKTQTVVDELGKIISLDNLSQ